MSSNENTTPETEGDDRADTVAIDAAADAAAREADAASAAPDAPAPEAGAEGPAAGIRAANAAKAYQQAQAAADAPADADEPEAAPETKEPDYKAVAQHVQAEFDNYRKRVARERQDWQRDVLANFLKGFLPAFDDLDRTLEESRKNQSVESVCEGVGMARNNLWKTLQSAGITEIDAKGKKFDPRYHEALSMLPMPGAEPHTVFDVVKPGYMIGEFVVRPAQVIVVAEAPGATGAETPK